MELRHIRYFLAVAEERHFTRAAAKVGIGQPPLSQQIKDLEAEIGAALFRRVAHGAELTPAGEAFLAMVQEMPALAEQAKNAARRASRGEVGSLRVGFTASAACLQPGGALCHPRVSTRLPGRSLVTSGGQHDPLGAGIA
jgi:DNA-binding transcriptional LysR family regulator